MTTRRDLLRGGLALAAAGVAWTTQVHHLLTPAVAANEPGGLDPTARRAVQTLLHRARTGEHRPALRRVNPEWDLIERMIGGLALACAALRDPALADEIRPVLTQLALDTEAAADRRGHAHFLLPYVHGGRWRGPERSLFVDGELALLLGTALVLDDNRRLKKALARRTAFVREILEPSPIGSGESYPDECWAYCNATALAGLRAAEVLLGEHHDDLMQRFERGAREHLVHEGTGLLISGYTRRGEQTQPPEGSTLWWTSHTLRLSAPKLAKEQFELSRTALLRTRMGFGYALEWAPGYEAHVDVDSGGVVPILGAAPASSGLALVAAKSFDDAAMSRALWASVQLTGFVDESEGRWRMRAGNAVGDAVAAYAMVQGPVWSRLGAA